MKDGDDYIRGRVEAIMQSQPLNQFRTPVAVMYNDVMVVGHLDGMGPNGFWVRPIQLMYIPYQDTDSIRFADPEEVE